MKLPQKILLVFLNQQGMTETNPRGAAGEPRALGQPLLFTLGVQQPAFLPQDRPLASLQPLGNKAPQPQELPPSHSASHHGFTPPKPPRAEEMRPCPATGSWRAAEAFQQLLLWEGPWLALHPPPPSHTLCCHPQQPAGGFGGSGLCSHPGSRCLRAGAPAQSWLCRPHPCLSAHSGDPTIIQFSRTCL